ncbi:hypothetical protein D3C85_1433030 [compost metagenome]
MPEVAAVERPDVRLVDQADAIAEMFDFEPLIAADDLHVQFPSDEKKRVWQVGVSSLISCVAPDLMSCRARREERGLVVPNKVRATQPCTTSDPALRVVPKSELGCVAVLGKETTLTYGLRLA